MRITKQALNRELGWQGFIIPMPEDWSFAAFSGDWNSGYLRAEGPNDAALELKWKYDKSSPSLKRLLKGYVKQLNKAAGRRKADVEVREKPSALSSVPQGGGVSQTFSWRSGVTGVGAVWHCLSCRRIVLVQVTSPDQKTAESLAKRIIPNIVDHPEGEECLWSVYDFTFIAPKAYRLEKSGLKSGHLSLELRKGTRRLIVERYGPANVILKRDTLRDWSTAVKPIFDRLKPFKYAKEATTDEDGHEIVRLIGRRKSIKDVAARVGMWLIRRQAPDALNTKIWSCQESNRIYMVMSEAEPKTSAELTESVAASIRCDETPEES